MDIQGHFWKNAWRRILDAGVKEKEKLKVSVCLPYVRGLSEQIKQILDRLEIGVVFKPGLMESQHDGRCEGCS